jgi:hypothetical protein
MTWALPPRTDAKSPVGLRVSFDAGWAETSDAFGEYLQVGDRLVPPHVDVHFEGDGVQPSLDLRLEVVDGVTQCRELRITSAPGGREVKALDLAAVRLREWVEELYALFAWEVVDRQAGFVRATMSASDAAHVDAVRAFQRARKGKGARKITRAFLEEVAKVYRDNLGGKPTEAVGRQYVVAPRTAAGYVEQARAAGILPPTTRGKKGA